MGVDNSGSSPCFNYVTSSDSSRVPPPLLNDSPMKAIKSGISEKIPLTNCKHEDEMLMIMNKKKKKRKDNNFNQEKKKEKKGCLH